MSHARRLQDGHAKFCMTKRYVARFPHCTGAFIDMSILAVVVRFAAFLRQPCDKAYGYLAAFVRQMHGITITSVVRTPCMSCSSLATASHVLQLSYVFQKTHTNRKENEHVENLVFDVAAALGPCFSSGSLAMLFTTP